MLFLLFWKSVFYLLFSALHLTAVRNVSCASAFEFQLKGSTSVWTRNSAGSSTKEDKWTRNRPAHEGPSGCICLCFAEECVRTSWCILEEPFLHMCTYSVHTISRAITFPNFERGGDNMCIIFLLWWERAGKNMFFKCWSVLIF